MTTWFEWTGSIRTPWGGIKLLVDSDDAAEAEQILSQRIAEHFEVPDVGEYEQPRCPKCQSFDITFRELDLATFFSWALTWLGLGVLVPIQPRAWHCRHAMLNGKMKAFPAPHKQLH